MRIPSLLLALAAFTMAVQAAPPHPTAKDHPIIGRWVISLPDGSCSETYTFPEGNALARFGMLGFLMGSVPERGDEDLYRERFRGELSHAIHKHGLTGALRRVFDITEGEL